MSKKKKHLAALSAGHELTLATARDVLAEGGNAFDAAIASVFAMFMTEPCMASAGAGGFASCFTKETGIEVLDFFTQTPLHKRSMANADYQSILVNFGGEKEEFHIGRASMAVPGLIAALFELHKRWGTIPMKVLVQASAELRKNGVQINTFQALDLGLLEPVFRQAPEMGGAFFTGDRILQEGDVLQLPNLQNFLDFLVDEEDRGFYLGDIAKQVAQDCRDKGGFLTRKDFEQYKCFWRKPHFMPYRQQQIAIPPSPSLGGMILSLLLHQRGQGLNLSQAIHAIQKKYPTKAEIIRAASRLFGIKPPSKNVWSTRGTSHFNILDPDGNAIALTVSLGEGSGYFIPGTDMQMNNMLGETYLLPNGHFSWPENTRMLSMMCPIIAINKENIPTLIGGSGGAGRIPYALLQVIENFFGAGLNLEEAITMPRMMLHNNKFHLEKNHSEIVAPEGQSIIHWSNQSLFFGGVHAISQRESVLEAAGDPRRYGVGEVMQAP